MHDVLTMQFAGALIVLALADSTSFGTLVLPAWVLAQPRVRVKVILAYLTALAFFYWTLGVAMVLGLDAVLPVLDDLKKSPEAAWIQLVAGVCLLATSFLFDGSIGAWRARRREKRGLPSRSEQWREAISGDGARWSTGVKVALVAGAVETASMVPYLAAIGLLVSTEVPPVLGIGVLAAYCIVMVIPALIMLALRLLVARWVEGGLGRIARWFDERSGEVLAWTLGVVGYLVAADGLGRVLALQ